MLLLNLWMDEYGGSFDNCMCFLFEVFEVVCVVWLFSKLLMVWVFGMDWKEGGWDVELMVVFVKVFEVCGVDVIYVFSGGLVLDVKMSIGLGY